MPMPSPVRAIMEVFNHQTITAFETAPETVLPAPTFLTITPATPTLHRQVLERTVDPALFTPTKRMRLMTTGLAATSSGSFLVGKPHITSVQTVADPIYAPRTSIPNPDWTLLNRAGGPLSRSRSELEAHIAALESNLYLSQQQIVSKDAAIERAHAQLAVGSVYNGRLNEALNTKENKKIADNTRLFPNGEPRLLTGDKFHSETILARDRREEKDAAKVQRAEDRQGKKTRKAAEDAAWIALKAAHEVVVKAWEAEKLVLRAHGVKVKDLPKKPK